MTVRVITFGDGRLNPLGSHTRQRLYEDLQAAESDASVTSVVLTGNGSNFSAGADLTEFDSLGSSQGVSLVDVVNYIEHFSKPIVAAIQGVALGGGLELALACHYRVASPAARMGLPETTVGVIPGAGGTQRLPRLVGVQTALDTILTGKQVSSTQAFDMGLVDAVSSTNKEQSVQQCAAKWADWAQLMPLADRRVSRLPLQESSTQVQAICKAVALKLPPRERGGESVHCALEAVAACASPNGMQREGELFFRALSKGAGQRHAFFAVRAAQKSKLAPPKQHALLTKPPSVPVGVVGAGTMGSGIALVLLQAGFTVHLVDIQQEALQKGIAFLQRTVQSMVTKGSLLGSKASSILKRLLPSQSLQDMKDCMLVLEAVVENLDIKRKIFTTLGQVTPPTALLLSNTSTLNINEMAAVLSPERQGYCAGWHFFSPAHRMKLVEIVVASQTLPETVALLQLLTKRIGKVGVTVGCCDGFVGNRMLAPYTGECCLLLAGGDATVESVDRAIVDFGMAMGVFAMSDLAGNDIGYVVEKCSIVIVTFSAVFLTFSISYFIRKEKGLVKDPKTGRAPNRKPGMRYTDLGDDLVTELGRVGQKAMKGWYDYDPKVGKGRKPIPSPEVAIFIQGYVVDKSKGMLSSNQIVERVLFPLVNEGFKILEEGIAQKPSDIDVVYLYGYGWPAWRGGPMFWADNEIGLPYLLARLQHFHRQFPGSDYYKPSRLLEECVNQDLTVEEYFKRGMQQTTSKL